MSSTVVESSDLAGQRNLRIEKLNKLRELGINPFPSKSAKQYSNKEIVEKFEEFNGKEIILAGRITSLRLHGKLVFADITDASGKIQLYVKSDELQKEDSNTLSFDELNLLDTGDFIEVKGEITKTQRGEISILAKNIRLLTKAIRPMPTEMEEKEERYRRRYLDMNIHPEVRARFERRAIFWEKTREFLTKKGFYEVNIPVLEHTTGGADAKPFVTHFDALGEDFYLRISHELPLKRLIGGGFEKVFDLGPRFRNEGLSEEHLPEHVAMEFYWAYADYKDGMKLIMDLYRYVMQEVWRTQQFKIKGFDVDLSKEWEILDYLPLLNSTFNVDVINDPVVKLNKVLEEKGVNLEGDINRNRVVDNLWKVIRKTIAGPAFLTGVPKFMSPLAKSNLENDQITDRFQPIIAGSELGNGYSELNDPLDQLERFTEQQGLRDAGDDEAQMLDIDFVEMLEYGMPPTVGWGHSERVFWFFEGVTAKEGVPFPQLKFTIDEATRKLYPELKDEFDRQEKAKHGESQN
ncbi:MAG: lysine--tRNA ligase [Candidatus Dojkabacteria bacterium]